MAIQAELSPGTQREVARWYRLKDHAVQLALINDTARFKVVPAGRRSGKTERFKRFVVKQAMANPGRRYFAAAPTRDQVKKIFWSDLKLLSFASMQPKRPSESDLIIYYANGAELHLIGLDQPARIEGIVWANKIHLNTPTLPKPKRKSVLQADLAAKRAWTNRLHLCARIG